MTVEDVRLWIMDHGIGHACQSRIDSTFSFTACGRLGNFHRFTTDHPAVICQRCLERLPFATALEVPK